MKMSFRGNKRNEGYTLVIALYFIAALSFVVVALEGYVNAEYMAAVKKSELFYTTLEQENKSVRSAWNNEIR